MSKKNNDFFKAKKEWSEVKDNILACYFKPYVSKILHTYKPLVYIDCFAGKGKFDDGNPGSPLIALKIIEECLETTTMRNPDIETIFIDLNYAADLRKNLASYPTAKIVPGKYEDNISNILKGKNGKNVFLYADRLAALKFLHDAGCKTWVSVEPYPTPNLIEQDLMEILETISFTDRIIFGRTNYSKEISSYKAHRQFYNQEAQKVIDFCKEKNIAFHIKNGTITSEGRK